MKIFHQTKQRKSSRFIAPQTVACIAALTAILSGCPSMPPMTRPAPSQMPTYQELAARYNEHLVQIDRLWSRAVVELQWHDDQGTHYEQGDGNLIIVQPHHVALSIGKLGHTVMWAGSDESQYWLFDLRQNHELFIGKHSRMSLTESHRWPLPVGPLELKTLLGLSPIQRVANGQQPTVVWNKGAFVIEPPGQKQRLWIAPDSARPIQIDLLNEAGQNQATCHLARWKPMTLEGVPPGAFPWVATRLEVSLVNQKGTMTLFLSDVSDGRAENKIKNKAFDLQHLVKVFKPDRIVDLDL